MFDLKLIAQSGEKTCGQTCLAMLSNKTEIDICRIIGHCKSTKTKELVKCLKSLHMKCDKNLYVMSRDRILPQIAILKVVPANRKASGDWHWVVKYNDIIYDPHGCMFKYIKRMRRFGGFRITSFLEIYSHA